MAEQQTGVRMIVTGERQFQSAFAASALSVRGLRNALAEANLAMETTRRRSFLMNQMLFTARRLIYAGTLAMIGFGAAAAVMGFKFNVAMENNRVAMTQFLGSAEAAEKELNYLYEVAARTPFEFTNIVEATRRFLAFGFTLQETNRYLNIMADTAAAFGGSTEIIQRLVLVFGQMRAAGRVLGQDLLQLQQIGVPVLQILQEQLGLTRDEMAQIGRLRIPANIAIEAIMRGLNERFAGMSEKQARTLQGRLSTLHDYAARMFGALTMPLYNKLRDQVIPQLTYLANDMAKAAQAGLGVRGVIGTIDMRYGTNLVQMYDDITAAAKALWDVTKNGLIPILSKLNQLFHPLHTILSMIAFTLGFFAKHTILLRIVLIMLLIEFVRFHAVLILFGGASGHGGLIGATARGLIHLGQRFTAWRNLIQITRLMAINSWTWMTQSWSIFVRGYVKGADRMIVMTKFQQKALLGLRSAFAGTTLAGLGYVGVALLILYILVEMYFKWKAFHDLVNRSARWLWQYYGVLMLIVAVFLGPLNAAWILAYKSWDSIRVVLMFIVDVIKILVHWLQRAWRLISKIFGAMGSFLSPIGHAVGAAANFLKPPGLQTGGMAVGGGAFLVGERGPELAFLPAGAAVTPVSSTNKPLGQAFMRGQQQQPLELRVYLDGKQIMRRVVKHENDARARA